MVKIASLAVLLAAGAHAKWLGVTNWQRGNLHLCRVAEGETEQEVNAILNNHGNYDNPFYYLAIGGGCEKLPTTKSKQRWKYWNDFGTIYHETDDRQWSCRLSPQFTCNAGEGKSTHYAPPR